MKTEGIWIAVLLILTGCSDRGGQADYPVYGKYPLLLNDVSLVVPTRAENQDVPLSEGTEIGLYAIDRANGTFNTGDSRRNAYYCVADKKGTITSLDPAILEEDHSYDIYAYAPIHFIGLEETTDDVVFSVSHGEDILYAPVTSLFRVSGKNCTVGLQFTHRMAQVQFTLIPANELNEKYLKGATFEIGGFYENAVLSLKNGTLTVDTGNNVVIRNRPDLSQTESVCVIPDSGMQTLTITLTTDLKGSQSKTFDFRFEPGKSYQFTIKYTITLDLEITNSIAPWQDLDGGSIDIGGSPI